MPRLLQVALWMAQLNAAALGQNITSSEAAERSTDDDDDGGLGTGALVVVVIGSTCLSCILLAGALCWREHAANQAEARKRAQVLQEIDGASGGMNMNPSYVDTLPRRGSTVDVQGHTIPLDVAPREKKSKGGKRPKKGSVGAATCQYASASGRKCHAVVTLANRGSHSLCETHMCSADGCSEGKSSKEQFCARHAGARMSMGAGSATRPGSSSVEMWVPTAAVGDGGTDTMTSTATEQVLRACACVRFCARVSRPCLVLLCCLPAVRV